MAAICHFISQILVVIPTTQLAMPLPHCLATIIPSCIYIDLRRSTWDVLAIVSRMLSTDVCIASATVIFSSVCNTTSRQGGLATPARLRHLEITFSANAHSFRI